jgi:hypothetical protein
MERHHWASKMKLSLWEAVLAWSHWVYGPRQALLSLLRVLSLWRPLAPPEAIWVTGQAWMMHQHSDEEMLKYHVAMVQPRRISPLANLLPWVLALS